MRLLLQDRWVAIHEVGEGSELLLVEESNGDLGLEEGQYLGLTMITWITYRNDLT